MKAPACRGGIHRHGLKPGDCKSLGQTGEAAFGGLCVNLGGLLQRRGHFVQSGDCLQGGGFAQFVRLELEWMGLGFLFASKLKVAGGKNARQVTY